LATASTWATIADFLELPTGFARANGYSQRNQGNPFFVINEKVPLPEKDNLRENLFQDKRFACP
jgi:hypothetical protein